MSIDFLFADFDRLIQSAESVHRLRRFILDLAVRGKLAPQDPNDEPASELMKRIAAEKARLVKTGEIKKNKAKPIQMASDPFKVPASWEWAAIGDVFLYDAGTKREPTVLDQKQWLLELEDIEKDTGRLLVRTRVCERESRSTKSEFHVGDILYGKLRPYLNKVLVADKPGYSTTEIVALRPHLPLRSEYCALALRRPDFVDYVTRLGQGTKMPRLRTEDAVKSPFPLPPLAEQHRIVARVNELMALCDRLEAARAEREATRDRLATASLARLNAPDPDPAMFQHNVAFALNNLTPLTTRPDQIKALRQTILNLAVHGKLVPQDPNDEPASELLKRTAAKKVRLVAEGKIRKQKKLLPVHRDEVLVEDIPGWIWVRLGEVSTKITKGSTPTSYGHAYTKEGVNFVKVESIKVGSLLHENIMSFIANETHGFMARSQLAAGDILFSIAGSIGTCAVVTNRVLPANTNQALAIIRGTQTAFLAEFLLKLLQSSVAQSVVTKARGGAMNNISLGDIQNSVVPVPPLAEQHRIVAKIDELMRLCDQLETSLEIGDHTDHNLLATLLHEALEQDTDL